MKTADDPIDDDELRHLINIPNAANHGYYPDTGEKWIIKFDGVRIRAYSGLTSWRSKKLATNALANSHNMYWEIRNTLARLRQVDQINYRVMYDKKFRKKYVEALIASGRVVIERIQ